jgi:hypothetical protein
MTHLLCYSMTVLPNVGLQGAIIVMIVELILTLLFFLLCFNDQLPGIPPPTILP